MTSIAAIRVPVELKGPLWLSGVFHVALIVFIVFQGFYAQSGEGWGGAGGAITVGVVGSVPGIPMPRPEVITPNRVVDDSKGLYKTDPPEIKQPLPKDAVTIPKFSKLKPPPKYVTRPSKVLENKTPPPPNAVPYGGGGAPSVPYTSFAMGAGSSTQGGLNFGETGNGDFGSRFDWYVRAVQGRVSSNWLQSTIDAGISVAPRVTATFDILRDGTITNIQITHSSGNYSVDASALRALQNSSPLDRLPPEYAGSKVSVEFWFDFQRQ